MIRYLRELKGGKKNMTKTKPLSFVNGLQKQGAKIVRKSAKTQKSGAKTVRKVMKEFHI